MPKIVGNLDVRETAAAADPASGFGRLYTDPTTKQIFERTSAGVLVPLGFGNPMTTAGDIITGGVSGAPTRLAKGSNSRLFSVDSGGTLGYRQLTLADIPAALITSLSQTSLTNFQTTSSTTLVNLANSSITTAGTVGRTLISIIGGAYNTLAGNYVSIAILEDGGVIAADVFLNTSATNSAFVTFGGVYIRTASAGSHTYSMQWRVSAGSGFLNTCTIGLIELNR